MSRTPKRVWITRAEPGAARTAARLRDMGFEPIVAPLLAIEQLTPPVPDLATFAALAFTSVNGVAAFAALTPGRDLPVFAVGDATAQAALDAGFADVRSIAGGIEAWREAGLPVVTRHRRDDRCCDEGPQLHHGVDHARVRSYRSSASRRSSAWSTTRCG